MANIVRKEDLLVELKMIELGIVPFRDRGFVDGIRANTVASLLDSLSPEDRRSAKRKFRKMWKKAYKKLKLSSCANTKKRPAPAELHRRRAAVYRMILSEFIG